MRLPKRLWRILRSKRFRRFLILGPFGLCIGLTLFYSTVNVTGRTRLERARQMLVEHGHPVTIDDLRESDPSPENDIARHPVIARMDPYDLGGGLVVQDLLSDAGVEDEMIERIRASEPENGLETDSPSPREAEDLLALLSQEEEFALELSEAFERPNYSIRIVHDDSELPGLRGLPAAAITSHPFFLSRARLHLIAGNAPDAMRDLATARRIVRSAGDRSANVFEAMLALGAEANFTTACWEAAQRDTLSDKKLGRLDQWLLEFDDHTRLIEALERELVMRTLVHNSYFASFTTLPYEKMDWSDNLSYDPEESLETLRAWLWQIQPRGFIDMQEAEALRRYDRLFLHTDHGKSRERFTHTDLERFERLRKEVTPMPNTIEFVGNRLEDEIWWGVVNMIEKRLLLDAHIRLARVSIACERYRLKHGRQPEDLAQLVPAYLENVPVSSFDGKPLSISSGPDGATLVIASGANGDEPVQWRLSNNKQTREQTR